MDSQGSGYFIEFHLTNNIANLVKKAKTPQKPLKHVFSCCLFVCCLFLFFLSSTEIVTNSNKAFIIKQFLFFKKQKKI